MAENNDGKQAGSEQKQPTKLVSAGKPQPASPLGGISELENIESKTDGGEATGAEKKVEKSTTDDSKEKNGKEAGGNAGGDGAGDGTGGVNAGDGKSKDVPTLTKEQIKTLFDFDGTQEEFKAHLAKQGGSKKEDTTEKHEPTAEEKAAQGKIHEERVVKKFISGGGTYEQYAAVKALSNVKPEDISLSETKRELKDAGFKEEEVDALVKEHYFMLSDDEIAQYEDETDREFAKRKREYGQKQLNGRASGLITQAKNALKELSDSIDAEDLLDKKEKEFSATVAEHFSKIEPKVKFSLGEQDGKEIAALEFEYNPADVEEVKTLLSNKDKRQQLFFNEDGTTLNLTNIAEILLRNKSLEKAVKHAYTTGVDRQVEEFEKVFPKSAKDVGLGTGAAANNGKNNKGKVVGYGKAVVGTPQH